MSHFSRIKVQIQDSARLLETLVELGHTVEENEQVRGYRGQTTASDYVIRRPNGYDVGFQKGADGNYEIVADFYGAGRETRQWVGAIQQKYAHKTLMATVHDQGYTVEEEEVMADGTVRVVLGRWV